MRSVIFWLACGILPVQAEEVLRLQVPSGPESLRQLMETFPQGNYTFDARGVCYVAGDHLRDLEFPSDFPCIWLPLDVEATRLELKYEVAWCSRVTFRANFPQVPVLLSQRGDFYALSANDLLDNPAFPFRPVSSGDRTQPELWMEALCDIDQVDGPEGVGMGCMPSHAYLLFCHLQQLGASAVPFLVTIVEEGTPSARLMACKALAQIGEDKLAKRGLADLLDCEEVVTWRSGCSVSHHPASFLAGWILEHPDRNF